MYYFLRLGNYWPGYRLLEGLKFVLLFLKISGVLLKDLLGSGSLTDWAQAYHPLFLWSQEPEIFNFLVMIANLDELPKRDFLLCIHLITIAMYCFPFQVVLTTCETLGVASWNNLADAKTFFHFVAKHVPDVIVSVTSPPSPR